MVLQNLHIYDLDTSTWHLFDSIHEWWASTCTVGTSDRKVKASITMLVSWVIWNERNTRLFQYKSAPSQILLNTIIDETNL